MEEINFKLVFDRGMSRMEDYVLASSREEAEIKGRKIARDLCEHGLDTVLVAVRDQADDEYYQNEV